MVSTPNQFLGTSTSPDLDIQLWALLVDPRNQQRNTKRPTHDALLPVSAFSEPQCQIADCLRTALHP